jgi:hypothetical protein
MRTQELRRDLFLHAFDPDLLPTQADQILVALGKSAERDPDSGRPGGKLPECFQKALFVRIKGRFQFFKGQRRKLPFFILGLDEGFEFGDENLDLCDISGA